MTVPIDIPVRYLGGERPLRCTLRIADAGVELHSRKEHGGFPWDRVRRISFEDPGRTKANVGAIALFGVLGLASRRAFTLIIVSTDQEELYFDNEMPIGQWRAAAYRIIESFPVVGGRVWVDGAVLGGAPVVQPTQGPGWYPDPLGMPRLRWHDGTSWTDHTAPIPEPPR